MKTLLNSALKTLAVITVLTAGATALTPATAHAAPLLVVNEGHHDGYHRGPYHRGPYHRGYGAHCRTNVFYRHGYRHVVRHCW